MSIRNAFSAIQTRVKVWKVASKRRGSRRLIFLCHHINTVVYNDNPFLALAWDQSGCQLFHNNVHFSQWQTGSLKPSEQLVYILHNIATWPLSLTDSTIQPFITSQYHTPMKLRVFSN